MMPRKGLRGGGLGNTILIFVLCLSFLLYLGGEAVGSLSLNNTVKTMDKVSGQAQLIVNSSATGNLVGISSGIFGFTSNVFISVMVFLFDVMLMPASIFNAMIGLPYELGHFLTLLLSTIFLFALITWGKSGFDL